MDGKRFKYISAISLLTVWGALGPWLERTGACWLVQQAPWDMEYLIEFLIEKRKQILLCFPEWLNKLEALLEIPFLKKLWKPQLHVIC